MGFFNEFPHTRTYDNDLGWIIKTVKSYDDVISALNQWIETNTPKIEDLEKFKAALESGDLPAGVAEGIREWCVRNLYTLIGEAIKTCFFVLENGYLVAYIPDSWDEITFGTTGLDDFVANYDFGHLTLTY